MILMRVSNVVQKNSNDDDDSDEDDDVLKENSMQVAAQDLEYENDQVEDMQDNNKYIEPEVRILVSLMIMVG